MTKISSINAREILDSRGNPTVETTVVLEDGSMGTAGVPSGASVGTYEAVELRDKDTSRFNGLGVLKAVSNVNTVIAPKIIGTSSENQKNIDQTLIEMDGTPNKGNLGANSLLSVSMAIACATAKSLHIPLYKYFQSLAVSYNLDIKQLHMPTPTFNIINGGQHGGGDMEFQEFHIVPSTKKDFHEAIRLGSEVYHALKKLLTIRHLVRSVGDEGGFAPNLSSNRQACEIITQSIKTTPYTLGIDVFLGLDLAANYFFKNDRYVLKDKSASLTRDDFINYLVQFNEKYPLSYLEDALSEDDWEGWKKLTDVLGPKTMIVGDDLLVTSPSRLRLAIEKHACNAIIIKPNQIGTVSETIEVVKMAKDAGFKTIVSHRSGETNDTCNADLAVGVGADYVKFGAPARGERVGKYNRLLEIETEISPK